MVTKVVQNELQINSLIEINDRNMNDKFLEISTQNYIPIYFFVISYSLCL